MGEIEFLGSVETRRVRRLTIGSIMALIGVVALTLAFVRGWEIGCAVVAAWVVALLGLVEGLTRRTRWSRLQVATAVTIGYPWLATALVGTLLAVQATSDLGPLPAEILLILLRTILVGVPVALVLNYYLVVATAYPLRPPSPPIPATPTPAPAPPPDPALQSLIVASVASWGSSLLALALALTLLG